MNRNTERAAVLGLGICRKNMKDTLDAITELARENRKSGKTDVLVTLNVDFVVNTHCAWRAKPRNEELYKVMRRAPVVSADGMPILILARCLGVPLSERVAGADMVPLLAERSVKEGMILYFLGGKPENTNRAAELLKERYPGLRIAGTDTPYVKLDESAETRAQDVEICAKIAEARPDILFTAFGNPKQELWADRNRELLHVPVVIGIGGTFNFICGDVRRAPEWMRHSGLEWIYRIIQEPKRLFMRYFKGFFIYGMIAGREMLAEAVGRLWGKTSNLAAPAEENGMLVLDCAKLSNVDNESRLRILDAQLEAERKHLTLHFKNLSGFAAFQLSEHRLKVK